jgi:hypothetical protein
MKNFAIIIAVVLLAAAMFFTGRGCGGNAGGEVRTRTRVDTLIVRDTLRDTVLVPVERFVVRVDTVWMRAAGDTARVEAARAAVAADRVAADRVAADSVRVALPVERKVYLTPDYRAVVEGFRPSLVEMELYPRNLHITHETTMRKPAPRWGIGIQAGYGISPKGAVPYVGIGIQYRVAGW